VQRRAVKGVKEVDAEGSDGPGLAGELDRLMGMPATADAGIAGWERRYAEHVAGWLADEAANSEPLATAQRYAAWATLSEEGRSKHRRGVLFKIPHRLDMRHLVPVETTVRDGVTMLRRPEDEWRRREGFALTDRGTDLTGALDQANYCIWCHNQGKDSCSTGLREKDGSFKKTVFGVTLAGCPLEEKISEMNLVKARGNTIGALAIITVDNPLCAATGHRICNGLHLSAAGSGRHPADRDPYPEGRARPALGFRDLFAADPVEPAQHQAAVAEAGDRPQSARRRPRPGRFYVGTPPSERRAFCRRDRRVEDRAAADRAFRHHC